MKVIMRVLKAELPKSYSAQEKTSRRRDKMKAFARGVCESGGQGSVATSSTAIQGQHGNDSGGPIAQSRGAARDRVPKSRIPVRLKQWPFRIPFTMSAYRSPVRFSL